MSHYLTLKSVGKPIAYFPKLAKYLKDINAAIFLGQFVYWHDKAHDSLGVYKTSEEIEEETGLSYKEQLRARKILKGLGLITETYKRLTHVMYYKFNELAFDKWLDSCITLTKGKLPIFPSGMSGEPQTEVREDPKGNIVIQENTSKSTTENLATPENDEENERMKIIDKHNILGTLNMPKKKEGKTNVSSLAIKWKEIRSEITGGYSSELTGKELGFLKLVLKDFGEQSKEALNYAHENWAKFAETACQQNGMENRPTQPVLAFIAQNRSILWGMLNNRQTPTTNQVEKPSTMASTVPRAIDDNQELFDALK